MNDNDLQIDNKSPATDDESSKQATQDTTSCGAPETEKASKKPGIASRVFDKIKNAGSQLAAFVKNEFDEMQEKSARKKHYEDNTETFFRLDANDTLQEMFHAIRDIDNKVLYIASVEKNLASIKSGVNVKCPDSSVIVVSQVSGEPSTQNIKGIDFECIKVTYKLKEEIPHFEQTVYNKATTNIEIGSNYGDISVINYMSQLDALEAEIKNAKSGIFGNGKKKEAIQMFGNFKNCVLNRTKDKTLFDRFVDLLKSVAPAAVTIATNIIKNL